jgi:Uma2 family endonuclease
MSKAAFLDWVQDRDERYELDRERTVLVPPASRAHWLIVGNLLRALAARSDVEKWDVLPRFAVSPEPQSVRFPDVIVDISGQSPKDLTATAPVLIAEILSPSSERVDLGDKAAEYLRLPSLAAYLVFAQDQIKAWVWTRGPAGFPPGPDVHEGDTATIRMVVWASICNSPRSTGTSKWTDARPQGLPPNVLPDPGIASREAVKYSSSVASRRS